MRKINMDTGEGVVHVSDIFGEVVNVILKGKSYYVMFKKDSYGDCCGCPFYTSDKGCGISYSVSVKVFDSINGYPWHVCAEVEDIVE